MNVERLINLVFARNSLWNKSDPHHHNRFVLDKLWEEVAVEMSSTRANVRAKWKTVRDTFRKELKKGPTLSTWPYFNSLQFLSDQFTSRPNCVGVYLPGVPNGKLESEEDSIGSESTNFEIKCENDIEWHSSVPIPKTLTETPWETEHNRLGDKNVSNALRELEQEKQNPTENKNSRIIDEDFSFFESLLPHITQLPPQRKMLLRIKMQELVYNFVYDNTC